MLWFLAGGFPMIFVLVFGLVAIGAAARFAWKPEVGRLGHLAALGASVLFASLAGVCVDLMTVSQQASGFVDESVTLAEIVLIGVGESMAPAILGFSLLAVTALISAIGMRQLPARVA